MQQKTEKPTTKKKKDSAKKGQIFFSRELVNWIILIGVSGFVFLTIDRTDLMFSFDFFNADGFSMPLGDYIRLICLSFFKLIAGIIGVSLALTILPTLIQTRFHLATEAIRIDFNKLNPVAGFKKIFSMRTLKEAIKVILYLLGSLSGVVLFTYIHKAEIFNLPNYELEKYIEKWRELIPVLFFYMLLPVLFVVAIDALVEFFMYIKELMMSQHEVKQEHKNMEGNPEIKRNRRRVHQELLSEQTKADIKSSKFILANPTHIAIGIYFNDEICHLPFVSLVEQNAKAVVVIRYAEKHGVPVIRNIPLARRIFKTAKQYQFVEQDNILEIMQILTWLEQVEQQWQQHDVDVEETEQPGNPGSETQKDNKDEHA
ncbi:EscU/YscU/HrcU family type III secretion system export apparatus switch protein [Mixta mediterraneensis]|uniref:EscU/YscU/HrcU family type III secretion system export apparatus switch protein n=1 Tax=Mixta mediterraneensis TaxID=2758443 RepID=UPI001874B738|nr:EscU/YscU/HrcU family type III secretion system export apparatus switch protein [Mixta mediterraneensis]MBE5251910.1 EscU/YscU/HrcU family type III secretion system export apparatus switch protein [Mixta mediterraneensis]